MSYFNFLKLIKLLQRVLLALPLLSFSTLLYTQSLPEAHYITLLHTHLGGEKEVTVPSGRADIVNDSLAIEVEWAHKWKNAIGQSLWYALQTNKQPAIILILEEKDDYKYFIQLNSALNYAGLQERVKVFLYPDDFE